LKIAFLFIPPHYNPILIFTFLNWKGQLSVRRTAQPKNLNLAPLDLCLNHYPCSAAYGQKLAAADADLQSGVVERSFLACFII
jgi:hypothetical protein